MSKRLTLWLVVRLLLIVGALPVLDMLLQSLFVDGRLSFGAWDGLLTSDRQWLLMRNSLLLAALVTLLIFALGMPLVLPGLLLAVSATLLATAASHRKAIRARRSCRKLIVINPGSIDSCRVSQRLRSR